MRRLFKRQTEVVASFSCGILYEVRKCSAKLTAVCECRCVCLQDDLRYSGVIVAHDELIYAQVIVEARL